MAPDTPINKSRGRRLLGTSRDNQDRSPSNEDTKRHRHPEQQLSVSAVAAFFEGSGVNNQVANVSTATKSCSDTNITNKTEARKSEGSSRHFSSTRDIVSATQLMEEEAEVDGEPAVKHNCVESLQKLVQIQQDQIGNLENELTRFASFFGEREDALLTQISALHGEIVRQAAVFRDLVRDNQNSRFGRSSFLEDATNYKEEIVVVEVSKCENGNLGFAVVAANEESKWSTGGVVVAEVSPFTTLGLLNGDWILKSPARVPLFFFEPVAKNEPFNQLKTMTAWPGERRTAAGALSRVTNSAGVTQQGALTCPPALMCCSPIWPLPATARRQVNGRDISKARHEDAVEAFRTAKEPIVVEVLRRDSSSLTSNGTLPGNQKPDDNKKMTTDDNCEAPSRGNSNRAKTAAAPSNATSPTLCDTSTQTEWTGGWGESPLVTFPQNGTGYLQSSPLRTVPLLTGEVITNFQPLNGAEVEDDDVGCEVEYEEVTLRRSSSSEKLGLTLCYGAPDDSDTDIYVSEVEPLSVAGKDGRIIEGDQLLQINGVEVRNREQAVSLFSEKRSDVTLLVARPQQGVAEDDDDDDDASDLCRSHNALIEEDELEDELEEVAGQHEKDSGVGRTDESTRNDESSEENLDHLDAVVAGTGSDALDAACTSGMTTGNDVTVSASDCERFREQLELKCASTSTTNLDMILKKPGPSSNQPKTNAPTPPIGRYQSDASLDREMALLNQEMEHIQLECESLVHRHMSESQKKATTSSPSSSCHTRVSGGSDSVAGDQLYVNLVDLQNQIRGRTSSASVASRIPSSSHPAAVSTEDVSTESNKPLSIRSRIQAMSKKEAVERWVKSMVFGRGRHGSVSSPSRQHQNHSEQERDSAYNTGGSTPLTLELSPLVLNPGQTGDKRSNVVSHHGSMMSLVSPRMEDKGTQLQESDVASIFSCDSCRRCCRALLQQQQSENFYQDSIRRRLSPDLTRNHGSNMHQASNRRHRAASDEGSSRGSALGSKDDLHYSEKNKNYVTFHPCATMYTNQANLQHTIWLQQQLFRDALQARETPQPGINITKKPPVIPTNGCRRSGSAGGASSGMVVLASPTTQSLVRSGLTSCPSSPSKGNTPVMEEVKMEWKVKRRADGTRYIARRPARNKILKERALKINEERTGLTTDDDAMSELKVGRYWSKEERKRHLERARDRKRKEMQLRTNRMTSVGTGSNQEHQNGDERVDDLVAVNNRPFTILELSQKKMLKKKGRAVFDDFTTVQEVLAHGNKVQGSKTLGLLSVTTV